MINFHFKGITVFPVLSIGRNGKWGRQRKEYIAAINQIRGYGGLD